MYLTERDCGLIYCVFLWGACETEIRYKERLKEFIIRPSFIIPVNQRPGYFQGTRYVFFMCLYMYISTVLIILLSTRDRLIEKRNLIN